MSVASPLYHARIPKKLVQVSCAIRDCVTRDVTRDDVTRDEGILACSNDRFSLLPYCCT